MTVQTPTQDAIEQLLYGQEEQTRRIVVSARDVYRSYIMGEVETKALRGASLDIYAGEYLSILGPSGSGKSTLFNQIGGLDKPTSGKVFIDEVDIAQLDAFELAWLRCRKVGYIFQSFNLIPVMTCLENVQLPLTFAGMGADDARDRAVEVLTMVGLGERVKHKPPQLSGGQQQRVAVARALANRPAIILADEPTANLDQVTGEEIIELLRELCDTQGVTVVSATHDMKMLSVSDRVVWLRDGAIDRVVNREDLDIQVGDIH
jgi:putative ABC transport system ATP-binding protein